MKKEKEFNAPHPIEFIKFRMEQMDFRQIDLVKAACGTPSHVSEILNKKRKLTLNFIRKFWKLDGGRKDYAMWVLIQDYKLPPLHTKSK